MDYGKPSLKERGGASHRAVGVDGIDTVPAEHFDDSGQHFRFKVRERNAALRANSERIPGLSVDEIKTASPKNNATVRKMIQRMRLLQAGEGLAIQRPNYSAKRPITRAQTIAAFMFCILLSLVGFLSNISAISIALLVCTAFYLCSVCLRAKMLAAYTGKRQSISKQALLETAANADLPTYSVLVALYQEANQVNQLCDSLTQLNWPKDRLEIKLICEADDDETILAITSLNLPSYFELVRVPVSNPRTKPKALNYALPRCTGEFLVLYDAEDLPHPDQILEAWQSFYIGDKKLACLQAPLHIHNFDQSILTRLFSIEYLTLFEGILPLLERLKIPMPLGGTSNHFKLSVLRSAGGWDPYNVTEDADLGLRLYRLGYTCGTISRPTLEEAPPFFADWLTQRTRWLKGWMQTILVHSRQPLRFFKEVGNWPAIGFHLLLSSIVVSALIHPVFAVFIFWKLAFGGFAIETMLEMLSALIFTFTLAAGYTTYCVLAYAVLKRNVRRASPAFLLLIPIYWLLISVAAWRALYQLIVSPHMWEKTRHGFSMNTQS